MQHLYMIKANNMQTTSAAPQKTAANIGKRSDGTLQPLGGEASVGSGNILALNVTHCWCSTRPLF